MSRGLCIALVMVVVLLLASCPSRAAATGFDVVYAPPVDAPVIDAFRPPLHRFGAGNRGFEYGTVAGEPVRAAAHGEVIFVGSVAGSRHVTLLHPDGLRTSYSFVSDFQVVVGQRVQRGDVIARSGERMHFGVRDPQDDYVDPALIFARGFTRRARLVPGADEGRLALVRSERASLLRLVLDAGTHGVERARLLAHYAAELRPDVRAAHVVDRLTRLHVQQRACTPADQPPTRIEQRRIAVLVGGLGSTSEHAAVDDVDTGALGFAPTDVIRFSYAGGRVPDPADGPAFAAIPDNDYASSGSTIDLDIAASRLSDLLQAISRSLPGVPVDVIAHSQGGVIARSAIVGAASRTELPAELASLATIGTPHGGADLATAAEVVRRADVAPLDAVVRAVGHDVDAPSVVQLSEISPFIQQLDDRPLPDRVRRVSIAAAGDLVVPVPRTMDPDLPSALVEVGGARAHDDLPGTPAVTRELALMLGGQPPTCRTSQDLLTDVLRGEAVSWATDALAAAMLARG